jgi:hypothetical protein
MSSIILCSHADDSFVVTNVNRRLTSTFRAGFLPVDGQTGSNQTGKQGSDRHRNAPFQNQSRNGTRKHLIL